MDICNLEFRLKSLNFIDHWLQLAKGPGQSFAIEVLQLRELHTYENAINKLLLLEGKKERKLVERVI